MKNNLKSNLVATVIHSIDSIKAKEIATRFLEQHYCVLEFKQAVLEGDVWTVTVLISSFGEQAKTIRIDARDGRIIDWSNKACIKTSSF